MLEVFQNFVEKLWEKDQYVFLVSALISIIVNIFANIFAPIKFIAYLPFSSHYDNVAIPYIEILIYAYVVISIIKISIQRYRNNKNTLIDNKEKEEKQKKLNAERIDNYRKMVDGWSDFEYSVVMYLLENENQKPYISHGYRCSSTILDDIALFNSSRKTPDGEEIEGKHSIVGGTQYLLTKQTYDELKFILEETGNISHFSRERVDIGQ